MKPEKTPNFFSSFATSNVDPLAERLAEWAKLNVVGKPERLCDFALAQRDCSENERRELALRLIAAEFSRLLSSDNPPSIETQAETRLDAFKARDFPLDRVKLIQCLISVRLRRGVDADETAALKERFPEFSDFVDRERLLLASLDSASATPSYASERPAPPTLTLTETYEIQEKIGHGGFKDVFRAQQKSTEQLVALKQLRNAAQSRQLNSEVVLQARLAHPNIPQILSYTQSPDAAPVLVERLIANGKSWRSLIDAMSLDENLTILLAVSRIAAYAHERRRVVHRDIKPENVMLGENDGRYNDIYLVDWGSAICLDDPVATKTSGGTVAYLPPESVGGDAAAISCAWDVFTLGDVLFRLLTGFAPYEKYCRDKGDLRVRATDVSLANVPVIPERHPRTNELNPPELIEIAQKALRKNPEERYANAAEFADALERYRRRASLGERLRVAQDSFARLKQDVENASAPSFKQRIVSTLTGRSGAFDARLIETTNEIRLVREEAASSDVVGSPSPLFCNAVRAERDAYRFVCDSTLKSKDFGVAKSLIAAAEKLEATVGDLPLAPVSHAVEVAKLRGRLNAGLARLRFQRGATLLSLFLCFAVLGLGVYTYRTNAEKNAAQAEVAQKEAEIAQKDKEAAEVKAKEAEAKAKIAQIEAQRQAEAQTAQIREIEQAVAPIAEADWSQGEVALRDFINAPNLTATNQHLAERSGIFLEAVSPRRVIVNSVAFSADEKYFAVAHNGGATIYRAPTQSSPSVNSVAQFPNVVPPFLNSVAQFMFNYDGAQRLVANPAFVDETHVDPKLAARFLLCRDDGVVFFLRFDETGATSTAKVDFRVSEPAQGRAPWGTPRWAQSDDAEPLLIVADASGAASFYALPDGRLLRKVQLCDAVGDAVPVVQTTPNGRTLFCAAPDGSFKRWSAETDAVETLDLPLSADADLSLGGLLRSLEISPDGQTLYASDESGKFVVWNVAAKKPIYVGQEPVDSAQCERVGVPATTNFISQIRRIDADRFLTLGFNDRWRVWDLSKRDENGVPTSVELRDENAEPSRGLRAADISPSKRYLALADNSHNFTLYDLQERRAIARSEGALLSRDPAVVGSDVAYDPRADRLLVGALDYSSVASFDPTTMRVATEHAPYPDPKSSLVTSRQIVPTNFAIPETGDEFAAAFESGDVFFFKDGVSEPVGKIENAFVKSEVGYDELLETAFSFSLKAQDAPEILDTPSVLDDLKFQEALLGANQVGFGNVALLAASPDGTRLVGKTMNGDELVLWDWKNRSEIKRWRVDKFGASREEIIASIKRGDSSHLTSYKHTLGLAFVSETELLEIKSDGVIVRRDVETGEPLATIPAPRPNVVSDVAIGRKPYPFSFRLSNDRKRLALGFSDGVLSVVDLETSQILFSTDEFSKQLPKRNVAAHRLENASAASDPLRRATGLAWSPDDALLCATFGSGRAILLETSYFTPLETFVVADAGADPVAGALHVTPFFTRDAKLVTFDSHGFMKRWDFRPSSEKPTELDAREGADYLSGTSRPNLWASVRDSVTRQFPFVVRDGDKEIYRRKNVEWFQRITEPGATRETFLLLGKDGLLSTVDETGAPVETGVAWNLNSPGAAEALSSLAETSPQASDESPSSDDEIAFEDDEIAFED
ncbi:MAG: protein kinase, partial [Thermoguttaceae bacterium]|nr:protein kinase [Thermoguttaceae bacterium]